MQGMGRNVTAQGAKRTMNLRLCLPLAFGLLGLGAGLAGCSVPPLENPKVLNTLVGQTALQIVQRFGVPTGTFQTQGHQFLAYNQTQTTFSSTDPGWGWGWGDYGWGGPGWGWGGPWGYEGPSTSMVTTESCQTTFELENDRVLGWKMRGDGC